MTSATAHMKDSESALLYFGARYYDSELLTAWLSVDPLADKYPSISPYAYCAWNPVNVVDPDGRDTISIYIDNGTIEQKRAGGNHSVNYYMDGNLVDSDVIEKEKCFFHTKSYDLTYLDDNKESKCHNGHLLCSNIDVGERIFRKVAEMGSPVEWDYYSMKNGYGDLSSSGIVDKMIHHEGDYTKKKVDFWDHYHPNSTSDNFYPSHTDQDHARELRGARCTIFNDGRSMDFNPYVKSKEKSYFSVNEFRSLWYRFAK